MLNDLDSRDSLSWLSRILWPDGSVPIARANRGQYDPDPELLWWASPSAAAPKILVPAGSQAAARSAVRRYHDGFTPARRLRSVLAETVMANRRLAGFCLRGRLVAAIEPSIERAGGAPLGSDFGIEEYSVLEGLKELLGVPELFVAVSLSTPKSNQKPVLQLLDGAGRDLGWAKVAWNPRTEALVANEARWLQADGPGGRSSLKRPTLLHDVRLAGRRVAVTSGVRPGRLPKRPPRNPPAPEVFLAVHRIGSTPVDTSITDSAWWRSVEDVMDWATKRERHAIAGAVERSAEVRFQLGLWHGDLTPWNLMSVGRSTVQLIDWEFAAEGVPLGFDLCHFHTQVSTELRGLDAPEALDVSARLTPHGLADLGVPAENRVATWRLYLVELIRRTLALRADGYPTGDVAQGPAALERLERSLGIFDAEAGKPLTTTGASSR